MGTPLLRHWRGRGLRWVATIALAVLAGALAAATVHRAEQARAAYGESRRVPVARSDLAVGDHLDESTVDWVERPAVVVPDGVADDPLGRVAVASIAAGEVLLDRRLSGSGTGPGGLLEPGARALAVPLDAGAPELAVGDRVDLYAPDLGSAGLADVARGRLSAADRVARGALVIAVGETTATLAVTATEAPGVAGALLDAALVLALVAPG